MTLQEITRDEDAREGSQYLVKLRIAATKKISWETGHFFNGTLFLNRQELKGEKRIAFYELPE